MTLRFHVIGMISLSVFCFHNPIHAQSSKLSGYIQTVPVISGQTNVNEQNISHFNRFRLSSDSVFGSVRVGVAYEQIVTFTEKHQPIGFGVGSVPSGGEWLNLQWTLNETDHARWSHRFDRVHVAWQPTDKLEIVAGRQAISWGTTLFLTPADPFAPFDPADPFREFRAGVDAARIRIYPSNLSEIDVVVRATKSPLGEEMTAVTRALAVWHNWEVSGWTGQLYGEPAGAVGVAGALGSWAVRGEAVIRRIRHTNIFRGTFGLDRLVQVKSRDLMIVFEYQRDGLGAAAPNDYLRILQSATYRRGEHQVLGRDETAVQISYQLHPLWNIAALWLQNLNDQSSLISPSIIFSVSNNASVSGGLFFGVGKDNITLDTPLPSEFGLAGVTGYLSLTWFF